MWTITGHYDLCALLRCRDSERKKEYAWRSRYASLDQSQSIGTVLVNHGCGQWSVWQLAILGLIPEPPDKVPNQKRSAELYSVGLPTIEPGSKHVWPVPQSNMAIAVPNVGSRCQYDHFQQTVREGGHDADRMRGRQRTQVRLALLRRVEAQEQVLRHRRVFRLHFP